MTMTAGVEVVAMMMTVVFRRAPATGIQIILHTPGGASASLERIKSAPLMVTWFLQSI